MEKGGVLSELFTSEASEQLRPPLFVVSEFLLRCHFLRAFLHRVVDVPNPISRLFEIAPFLSRLFFDWTRRNRMPRGHGDFCRDIQVVTRATVQLHRVCVVLRSSTPTHLSAADWIVSGRWRGILRL